MDVTSTATPQVTGGITILRAANQQPELAAELLRRSLEVTTPQETRTAQQPVDVSDITGTGTIINTTA